MTPRLALPLLALLFAVACNRTGQAPAATTPADTAAATPVPAMPAASEAPPVDPAVQGAVAAAVAAAASGAAPVAGTDYVEIAGGQPFDPLNGKIEVAEIFGYTCPHCAEFQELVNAWKPSLPPEVRFTYVPAPFGGYWEPYAKAYYAAEAMGVQAKTHDAVFRAIHFDRSLPVQPLPTNEQIGAFYANYGVNAAEFASTMSSFAINAKLNRAKQFITRSFGSDTPSTPTLVINGKYRITGKSFEDNLRIAQQLIAQERSGQTATAQP
jgi:thiol:disulfide interchange protein DsbA